MPTSRPNLVLVTVDQMHADALSAFGNPHVRTPNLDRVAAAGVAFRKNYCTMPQCCPSRASWYTGRMSTEHGVPVNSCPLNPALPDLGQWLRRYGDYETVYTGKWHVPGRNVANSFDVLLNSAQGELGDVALADSAVAYLENRRPDDQPFFLNVGFMNPHDCCYTAGAGGGVGKFAFAEEIREELPPLPASFQTNEKYGGRTAGWGEQGWRYYLYCYYRLVEMVEAQVGRVFEALQRSPYRDNTLFLFTSDHGDGLGFHGKVSKGFMEEEAWRVPALAVFPERIPAGQRDTDHLTSGVDVPATLCDYAGVPPLPKMTLGRSWRPLFEGRSVAWREYVVGETSVGGASAALRDARFKTIFHESRPSKVYDLEADPLEMHDLHDTPQGRQVEQRHRALFREYLSQIELCPTPTWGKLEPNQRRLYERYNAWYGQLSRES